VNQWLRWQPVDLRGYRLRILHFLTKLLREIISQIPFSLLRRNPFDCATPGSFCPRHGAERKFAMIETVTAFLGLMSAGIFLAHAFDGFRSRA